MDIAGYRLQDTIDAHGDTVVVRALSPQGQPVVLKLLDSERPDPEACARWRHEHAVLQGLDSPWIVRSLGLHDDGHRLMLVLEDFGQCHLGQLVQRQRLDLNERLALAQQLAQAVSDVHAARLIHGDLAPKNVLVDVPTLRLKLCDFGLSSRLDHEQRREHDAFLRGTLETMSPEQTGRTTLEVDYRSDFYSLGVTLYHLLAGQLPFQASDPTALLHAQLALVPRPLHELDPGIPAALSVVVHKLLAKHPDDRYQSSFGLLHDLDLCAQALRQRVNDPFEPGRRDVPERFCVSQRLLGRESEQASLLAAFERASAGRVEWLLLTGPSGVGKTALVAGLHAPVLARRGYFLRGKCDQFSRNEPYAALGQAFQHLMQQLALEGEERRAHWGRQLLHALGEQAGAVAALVPALVWLIGPPPPLPALPPAETEQRLHRAFARFVQVLATRSHPLVLFLDDLQWADVPTLHLLEHLVDDGGERSLLVVGAYRDGEVDAGHPLRHTLTAVARRDGRALTRLPLSPLGEGSVAQWLADSLRCSPTEAAPLAGLCHRKTAGNPFFLGQFLQALVRHGDVRYQRDAGGWVWDLAAIEQRAMTDNVVTLMLDRLRTLPPAAQALLAWAAPLGERFTLRELAAIAGLSTEAAANHLWPALQQGLVLPLDEHYKFADSPGPLGSAAFRFLHDRVQQAAHALTPEAERGRQSLQTGRALWTLADHGELGPRLFTVLGVLNAASDAMADPSERRRLLDLNLLGGLRAKAGSAHDSAVQCLRQARALLPPQAWQSEPDLAVQVFRELAEASYLAGDFAGADALIDEALAHTTDCLARARLALVRVDQFHLQGRYADAFPVLVDLLGSLGPPFPASDEAAFAAFAEAFAATEQALAGLGDEALLALPAMQDAASQLLMRACFAMTYASYQTGRFGAFLLTACRMVQTTLDAGQDELASVGMVAYVTALSAMRQPYAVCHARGRLAMRLAEQSPNPYFRVTVYQYFSAFYQHWGEPLAAGLPYLDRGLELGLVGINPLSAGFCALLRCVNRFVLGVPLDELEVECERGLNYLQQSRQTLTETMLRHGVLLPLRALRGLTRDATSFDTADEHPSALYDAPDAAPSVALALYSAAQLRHAYWLGDAQGWQRAVLRLPVIAQCLPDSPSMVESHFYAALGQLRPDFQPDAEAGCAQAQAVLDTWGTWAAQGGPDFAHKQWLLAAEVARVRGDGPSAMGLYAQAIDAADEAEYLGCLALANELYARFWQAQQQRQLATQCVREAHAHYRRWGAVLKCRQLEAQWPQVRFRVADGGGSVSGSRSSLGRISSTATHLPDVHALLKAHQLLAQELRLDTLLAQMLGVLIEGAGAEHGAIVLVDDTGLRVAVIGGQDAHRQTVCERVDRPLAEYAVGLPQALLAYVQLTGHTLVLNQPALDARFAASPYFVRNQPKSVVCLPVRTQGQLVALVYLENRRLEGAFTRKHLQTLELLGAQAAISLVNAMLVESLEAKVSARTEELRAMSMRDGLTGIANRRAFDERLALEWRRSRRQGEPLALLMLDIDHFKPFNDRHGHVAGDHCIQAVAATLAQVAGRSSDLVARYGGEEFAILLPQADLQAGIRMARACLEALQARALPHGVPPAGPLVTISIGVASCTAPDEGAPEQLIRLADQALYAAKRGGRNRWAAG